MNIFIKTVMLILSITLLTPAFAEDKKTLDHEFKIETKHSNLMLWLLNNSKIKIEGSITYEHTKAHGSDEIFGLAIYNNINCSYKAQTCTLNSKKESYSGFFNKIFGLNPEVYEDSITLTRAQIKKLNKLTKKYKMAKQNTTRPTIDAIIGKYKFTCSERKVNLGFEAGYTLHDICSTTKDGIEDKLVKNANNLEKAVKSLSPSSKYEHKASSDTILLGDTNKPSRKQLMQNSPSKSIKAVH